MPVLGEVTIIVVRGEDWLAADEADQHQYERPPVNSALS